MERLKRNLILALCLGLAVYLVLAVFSGLDDLAAAFRAFDWRLAPAILGLVALSYVVRYFRWSYYLKLLGVRVPTKVNAAIFAAGLSMAISPGKLGEVLKSVFVRQVNGAAIARTAPAVVAERATDGTGMVAWGLLGALAFRFGPGALLLFLAMTVAGIAVLRSKRLSLLAERVLSRVPVLKGVAPHLSDFHGASNRLLAAGPMVVGTALSFCSWGIEIVAVYLCVVALGLEVPFLMVVFIFAVSSLAGALFFTPGGIGVAEAGLYGMFRTIAGVSAGPAGALTFVIRLATLWFATLLGVAGLLVVRGMLGEEAAREATAGVEEAERTGSAGGESAGGEARGDEGAERTADRNA